MLIKIRKGDLINAIIESQVDADRYKILLQTEIASMKGWHEVT